MERVEWKRLENPNRVIAGPDPAILLRANQYVKTGYVYIMTNRPRGVLYVGVTSNLAARAWQHRQGEIDGFTSRYGLTRLAYFEVHGLVSAAIQREKAIKRWPRQWKIELIEKSNPAWLDLYETLNA